MIPARANTEKCLRIDVGLECGAERDSGMHDGHAVGDPIVIAPDVPVIVADDGTRFCNTMACHPFCDQRA